MWLKILITAFVLFFIMSHVLHYKLQRSACEMRNLKATVTANDKMQRIREARPDDESLFNSLRNGTF